MVCALYNRYDFLYLGFSGFHLNRATISDHHPKPKPGLQLYPKYTFHGGGSIRVNALCSLKPSFIFHYQGRIVNLTWDIRPNVERAPHFRAQYAIYTGFWLQLGNQRRQIPAMRLIGALLRL